jgi:hypothetical protein
LGLEQSGESGMLARNGAGRPPKVGAEQLRWIATAVREHTPDQLQFEAGLWTHKLVARLMERQWGLAVSRSTLTHAMTQLGWTPARPIHLAHEGDAGWGGHWAASVPQLNQRAKDRRARILFADAAELSGGCHAADEAAKAPGPLRMFSALSMMGEFQFMLVQGEADAQAFRTFLKQLMIGVWQPVLLAVDSQPVHRDRIVESYVQSTHGKLRLHHLPPYL